MSTRRGRCFGVARGTGQARRHGTRFPSAGAHGDVTPAHEIKKRLEQILFPMDYPWQAQAGNRTAHEYRGRGVRPHAGKAMVRSKIYTSIRLRQNMATSYQRAQPRSAQNKAFPRRQPRAGDQQSGLRGIMYSAVDAAPGSSRGQVSATSRRRKQQKAWVQNTQIMAALCSRTFFDRCQATEAVTLNLQGLLCCAWRFTVLINH